MDNLSLLFFKPVNDKDRREKTDDEGLQQNHPFGYIREAKAKPGLIIASIPQTPYLTTTSPFSLASIGSGDEGWFSVEYSSCQKALSIYMYIYVVTWAHREQITGWWEKSSSVAWLPSLFQHLFVCLILHLVYQITLHISMKYQAMNLTDIKAMCPD